MGEIIDKVKEKSKDVKDAIVDSTKDVADNAKYTLDQTENISVNSTDKEQEEGIAATNKNRKSDPLTEYSDQEPMTPAKLLTGEPTAVETQAIRKLLQKVRQVRILNRYEY